MLALTHRYIYTEMNYTEASLACSLDNGELLRPENAAEAVILFNQRTSGAQSPLIARVDALQNETCFSKTNSDEKFDVGAIDDIAVEAGILDGTDRTVVFDICGNVLNETIPREDEFFSVCKVDNVDEFLGAGGVSGDNSTVVAEEEEEEEETGPLTVIDIMRAKQEGNNYIWAVHNTQGGQPDSGAGTTVSLAVDNINSRRCCYMRSKLTIAIANDFLKLFLSMPREIINRA